MAAAVAWQNMRALSLKRLLHIIDECEPLALKGSLGSTLPVVLREEHHCVGGISKAVPGELYRFSWSDDCVKASFSLK